MPGLIPGIHALIVEGRSGDTIGRGFPAPTRIPTRNPIRTTFVNFNSR